LLRRVPARESDGGGDVVLLNAEVARGATPEQIASRWLASNGLDPGLD